MWSLFRLALLLLCAVAAVAWQDYPAGRAPGVTHESFCLPSAAVTKKPMARSRPYYDSTLPSLFVITFWAQPTQVLVITLKAWVRRGWEHVLDYQNLLREDECPITRQYDWRLADYTAEPRGRAWHDFQELSQAMREGGKQALPSVKRTRQECDHLLGWVRQHLDTAMASVLLGVGQLLVMLRLYMFEATWTLVSGVVGWVVGWVMAIVGGFLQGVFQILQAAWILAIALLRFRYQVVVLAYLTAWNVIAGTVLAVWTFLGSLVRDVLRGSVHHLVQAEDMVVIAVGGGMSMARNTVVGGGLTLQNAVVGGFVRVGEAVAAEITNVRNLVVDCWIGIKIFVWAVRQTIVLTIWQAQRSVVQAGVYFATSVRHSITNARRSTMRTAQSLVPRMPRAWTRTWWRLVAWIDAALPWIIAAVSCAFGCYMWWRARRAVAAEAAAAAAAAGGGGGGGAGPGRTREELAEEKRGREEEAMGVPRAMAAIRRVPPPLPPLVPPPSAPQPPPAQAPAQVVVERPLAGEEKREEEEEEEEEEWLLISRHRHRHVVGRVPGEQMPPSSSVRLQGREETTTMTATRVVRTEEVRMEAAEAPPTRLPPSPLPPAAAASLPLPSPPAPLEPPLIPVRVVLPFICAAWGVEHPDAAAVRASIGPRKWDDLLALYRQDFADRGLEAEVEVTKLEQRPDGRYDLPAEEIRFLLHPPDSDVSLYEFSRFCAAAEAAKVGLEGGRKAGAEVEDAATVGSEEVGQV